MGMIKDRNGMDLTEAEDIKKRCQEYTENLHKKDIHDPDSHDGVITHLEPDILEGKVKWALGSISTNKASGGDGYLFKIWRKFFSITVFISFINYGLYFDLFILLVISFIFIFLLSLFF